MKAVLIVNDTNVAWKIRRELIEGIIGRGYETVLVAGVLSFKSELEALGCRIIDVDPGRRGTDPVSDLKLLRSYRNILKAEKPDVVLMNNVKPDIYGGLACRALHIPHIPAVTGLGTPLENPGLLQKLVLTLYRLGMKKASAVMFENDSNREYFRRLKIGRNHTLVSGAGVNLSQNRFEEYPAPDTPVRLTFAGRIMRDKGILELLETAKTVRRKHPDVQFDLIGGFDESFQTAVEEAVRAGDVNYLGFQNEMHPFYKESWAVVMPSYHEGMCNVCLEGAATGRPVLASNIPGCRETFDDGVSGIGFEAKSAASLTEATERFLALSYEEKKAMGLAARRKMERDFDREQVVKDYLKEIEKATEGKKK